MHDLNGNLSVTLCLMLAALTTGMARAEFTVDVSAPDDVNFKDSFGSIEFPDIAEILSVQSPVPNLLLGDEASKNKVAFRGSMPNCGIKFSVIGKKTDGTIVKYDGTITVTPFKPSDVNHAVVVKGAPPLVNKLIDGLKGTYGVSVVSNTPSSAPGDSDVGIVLRDKGGNVIPKADADEIIKKKLSQLNNGLVVVKPGCYAKCRTICDSVLTFDPSKGFVESGVMKDPNGRAYLGMPTKWETRCGKDIFRGPMACGSVTCSAGTCRTTFDDSNYGVCKCPNVKNEERGPKCQILTRSYQGGLGAESITTSHRVKDNLDQPDTLSLSFKFAGKCQNADESLCTIVKVESGTTELVQVQLGRVTEPMYTTATLPSMPTDATKTVLRSERFVQHGMWMQVSVFAKLTGTKLKTVTVFCTIEPHPECLERTAESSLLSKQLTLQDAVIRIGGAFDGCFRNVRLNGRIVDLKIDSHSGPVGKTSETCSQQDDTCKGGSSYVCGDRSVCYGFLGADRKDMCRCSCIGDLRLTAEKITDPAVCAASCSVDLPVISTQADNSIISWAMQNGDQIPVPSPTRLQVRLRFRTRVHDTSHMLTIESTGPGAGAFSLKIQDETLHCCLSVNCYAFVPKVVSDGFWHEVHVSSAHSQLTLRVDDYSQVHLVASEMLISTFKVSMDLKNSCITGLRVADIYMPTGSADTTLDTSEALVKMTFDSGSVKIGAKCVDPSPSCTCNAATETCDGIWGAKSCSCRPGYVKSGSGTCAAPSDNPCNRLSIRCPNAGGTCKQVDGKWQICV